MNQSGDKVQICVEGLGNLNTVISNDKW